MKLLNIGCGTRFHPEWVNIDFVAHHRTVIQCDIRKGIAFPDNSFEGVYHCHVLEHIETDRAPDFLTENYRVLSSGGILRVVVPDLEKICRAYLESLDRSLQGDQGWGDNLYWMMLEMYDQTVRNRSGGDMARYLSNIPVVNRDFVISRCGKEVRDLIEIFEERDARGEGLQPVPRKKSFIDSIKESIVKYLLGEDYDALEIGRFRTSGEIHQWMYDRFSLKELLASCGFTQITVCDAHTSSIPEWESFCLDTEPDGSVYKPDSLYMEARKS